MTIYRSVCPLLAALFPAPFGRRGGRKTHIDSDVLCMMCGVQCPGGGGGTVLSVCAVFCRVGTRQSALVFDGPGVKETMALARVVVIRYTKSSHRLQSDFGSCAL